MDRQEIEHNKNSEDRRHGRLELETEVTIRSANGFLPGRTPKGLSHWRRDSRKGLEDSASASGTDRQARAQRFAGT